MADFEKQRGSKITNLILDFFRNLESFNCFFVSVQEVRHGLELKQSPHSSLQLMETNLALVH